MVGVALAACLVLTGIFLYPSAKQYYVTMRECDRLQAEYEAIENRNANIQSEVDALATDAGVEDRAREEFGWVKTGEHAVNVRGLDVGEDLSLIHILYDGGSFSSYGMISFDCYHSIF